MIDQFVSDFIHVLFVIWVWLAAAAFVIIAIVSAAMRGFRRGRDNGDAGDPLD